MHTQQNDKVNNWTFCDTAMAIWSSLCMKGHTHQSAILTWTLHIRKDSIIHISTTSIKKEQHQLDIYQFLHIHCSNTQPVQRGRIKAQKLHVLCVCVACAICVTCVTCVTCVMCVLHVLCMCVLHVMCVTCVMCVLHVLCMCVLHVMCVTCVMCVFVGETIIYDCELG